MSQSSLPSRLFACVLIATVCQILVACVSDSSLVAELTEDHRLEQRFDSIFDRDVSNSPTRQTSLGLKTADQNKWDDTSDAYAAERLAEAREDLRRLTEDFDYERLSTQSQLSHDIFAFTLQQRIDNAAFRRHFYVVDQFRGQFTGPLSLLQNSHNIDTRQDALDYISRIDGIEALMQEMVTQSRDRAAFGVMPPAFSYPAMITDLNRIVEQPPLMTDFISKVEALDLSEEDKHSLVQQAQAAVDGPFRRGYMALVDEVQRVSNLQTQTTGVWALPGGEAFYANRIAHHTNMDWTADQIHEFGKQDVARIHLEMKAVMAQVGFEGSLQEFFAFVRTDPNNFYDDSDAGREQFLADARAETAAIFKVAPKYFNQLPKAELEVRRVEPWRENSTSIAFYNRPSMDGSRPGIYYANLADMTGVQKYVFKAITFHEGVPGHHFQIALAQELDDLPKFRKFGGGNAFVEGWALYAERLAKEMGFYTDPMHDFGRLQDEIWRSVRLVTDTGIHSKRWTRQQAIDYFTENTPISEQDIVTEVERYFVNPGQALGYKMGMTRILELREQAEQALGNAFDIRAFHDVIIGQGPMPLPILAKQVVEYINTTGSTR